MPTTPTDYSIYTAILTALRTINGAGNYYYDLSSSVVEGLHDANAPPLGSGVCASVGCLPVSFDDGPDLGGTSNTARFAIQAWTPAADTAAARMLAGARLHSDIRQALKTARSTSSTALYTLHRMAFEGVHLDAAQLGLSLNGCYLEAELTVEFPISYTGTE